MWFTLGYGFGTQELLIIGGLVILLFGGSKVPELMRGLGQGIREFKRSVDGEESTPKSPSPPQPSSAAAAPAPDAEAAAIPAEDGANRPR